MSKLNQTYSRVTVVLPKMSSLEYSELDNETIVHPQNAFGPTADELAFSCVFFKKGSISPHTLSDFHSLQSTMSDRL